MAANAPRLILASRSPRRKQLLADAGYDFEVVPPEVDEATALCSQCGPAELVAELALKKAADVARRLAGDRRLWLNVVVACDTVVECGGVILGKPRDEEHARQMLAILTGQVHRVYSGLCVWPLWSGGPAVDIAITKLQMDPLSVDVREVYLASRQWEGKAGGFGYQDRLGWIHVDQGSESNVVGLPMELLARMLDALPSLPEEAG